MLRILLASMLLLISGTATAHAAGPAPAAQPEGKAQATRIEADQKTGAVKIIIDDREIARFDAHGLHVRGAVEYGGPSTDTGSTNYDKRMAAEPKH